jgi:hypothetical protein
MSANSARTTATPQKIKACLKNKKATENPHCKRSERNSAPSAMFNHGLSMRDLGVVGNGKFTPRGPTFRVVVQSGMINKSHSEGWLR